MTGLRVTADVSPPVPSFEQQDVRDHGFVILFHRRQRAWRLGATLRQRIDLFHSLRVSPLPTAPGGRVVATCYDIVHSVLPRRPGFAWTLAMRVERLQQMVLHRRPDHLVAISEATASDLRGVLAVPAGRITVIPLGVDTGRFSPAPAPEERVLLRERYGLPERFHLCVGSDHYRKNQFRLFEAWRAAVAQGVPEGLVFVGRGLYGDVRETLSGIAAREGLAGRFVWLEDVTDEALPAFYRQATALVAPSLHEGFGLTVLEAMACGTPVAAARAASLPEVGGDTAIYFDPLDDSGIAAALCRLSTDAALRDGLRARGFERVRQFSWKATPKAAARCREPLSFPTATRRRRGASSGDPFSTIASPSSSWPRRASAAKRAEVRQPRHAKVQAPAGTAAARGAART